MAFLTNLLKRTYLGKKLDEIADRLATVDELRARLAATEHKIDKLEIFSHGARATYVGGNRVLTKPSSRITRLHTSWRLTIDS